jgi:hypothetical protein
LPYNIYLRFGVFFRFCPENHKDVHVHSKLFLSTFKHFTSSVIDWQANELITRLLINENDYCLWQSIFAFARPLSRSGLISE